MKYTVHLNGKITNRISESALQNVIFTCLKDDEIRYADELAKKKERQS